MTLPADRPGAVVLLLAAGLLAALFAVTTFSPQPVDAQNDSLRNVIEVDGGRSSKMVFKVNPPAPGYLDPGDQIQITMPAEFDLPSSVDMEKIGFSGSGDGRAALLEARANGATSDETKTLTLTIPPDPDSGSTGDTLDERVGEGEHLVITIERDSGITAPETPKGFDDDKDGYDVAITFVNTDPDPDVTSPSDDKNIIVVKNPISSHVPSAAVRVVLVTYAEVQIGSAQEITVDFSGPSADSEFFVPTSIANTRVTISYTDSGTDGSLSDSFSPSEILVQGARVTLTVPPGTSANPTGKIVPRGEYTIAFSQSARIRNPLAAGTPKIKVFSFVEGDILDDITAVIRRTTTTKPLEGPRGSEFTLEGKGYARGTVTIYDGEDMTIDPGETLASVKTIRGAFTVKLRARSERAKRDEEGKLQYTLRTKDSYGVDDSANFKITSSVSFEPPVVSVGSKLKITVVDWEDENEDVVAVRIAGQTAFIVDITEYQNCIKDSGGYTAKDDVISFEVKVPRHVPSGEQTVSVYDHAELEYNDKPSCHHHKGLTGELVGSVQKGEGLKNEPEAIITETIDIDTSELTLSPSEAARGQKVTITGSGFTRAARGSDHIDSVWIGGKRGC